MEQTMGVDFNKQMEDLFIYIQETVGNWGLRIERGVWIPPKKSSMLTYTRYDAKYIKRKAHITMVGLSTLQSLVSRENS